MKERSISVAGATIRLIARFKQQLFLAAGFAISAACLWWIFKGVDKALLFEAIRTVNYLWVVPAVAVFMAGMWVRAVRWGLLFRPRHDLSGRRMFRPLMICFAFNNVLPSGRVGEFVRAVYVARKEETGLPTALATIVTERLFDGVTLLACLVFALSTMPDPAGLQVSFGGVELEGADIGRLMQMVVKGCVVIVAAVLIFLIPAVPRLIERCVRALPILPGALKDKLAAIVAGLARGFDAVRDVKTLAWVVLQSILVWATVAAGILWISYGFADITMSYRDAVAITALTSVFVLIPSAPGYWGLYEAGFIFALKILDIQQDESIGAVFAIATHLALYIPITVIGLTFAAQSQVKVKSIRDGASETAP